MISAPPLLNSQVSLFVAICSFGLCIERHSKFNINNSNDTHTQQIIM